MSNEKLSKFEIMEKRDEEQILAEAQGNIIEEMFYKFPLDGKTVTGISWVGTKEIARRYGGIRMGLPRVEDLGDVYAAVVAATDTRNDVTLVGSAMQSKTMVLRSGEEKPDRFAYTKAVSKAQRNAIRALIPEKFLLAMEAEFSAGKEKPPAYRESSVNVVAPIRPSKHSVLEYFELLGYNPRDFDVSEDNEVGVIYIKLRKYIDSAEFKDQMRELGGQWDKDGKQYVVYM